MQLAGAAHDKDLVPYDELRYVIFAREFGWTPEQTDSLSLDLERWFLPINTAINEANARRLAPAAQPPSQGGRHRR